jgi:ribosomal protein L11 methylase PrmA
MIDDHEHVHENRSTGRRSVVDDNNTDSKDMSTYGSDSGDMNTTTNNKITSTTTMATDTRNSNDEIVTHNETYHRRRSPAAQALFNAFDIQQQTNNKMGRCIIQERSITNSKGSNQQQQQQQVKSKIKSQYIQKQIHILGWRNRYSQSEYYPITIQTHPSWNHPDIADTMVSATASSPSSTTFHVKQVQRGEIENTYGTGATVWPASIVLIKYIERHAMDLIYNKTIIDLGTGTGITSIVAALLGAKHIICTDGEHSVVQLAKENIYNVALECCNKNNIATATSDYDDNNRLDYQTKFTSNVNNSNNKDSNNTDSTVHYINQCPIEVQQYWWGTGSIQSKIIQNQTISHIFDIILISDCVLPKLYPIEPLIDAIDQLLYLPTSTNDTDIETCNDTTTNNDINNHNNINHRPKQMAIVSYEHRYYELYDPRVYVKQLCNEKQLQIDIVPIEEQDEIYSIPDDIEIWHIYRKKSKTTKQIGTFKNQDPSDYAYDHSEF